MNFLARLAATTDQPLLLELMQEFYGEERLGFHPVKAASAVAELLASPALGQVWLLETDGVIAGYLVVVFSFILEFGGRQAYLDELYLRRGFRGRGLGRATLDFAADRCRADGIRILRLEVERANLRAIELYRRVGFELHDRHTMTRVLD